MIDLRQGDCLELMKDIPDKSIDMILCDLPYGTTACKWDTIIPFEPLWEQYNRIIKDNGAIALFGSEPFSSKLRMSNLKMYKYDWVWNKKNSGTGLLAKYQPLKITENIMIFGKNKVNYYPIMTKVDKVVNRKKFANKNMGEHLGNTILKIKQDTGYRYPKNILEFYKDTKNQYQNKYHPTQKPVALLEYLIKTYTNEGDTVLDNCMGSGSTGVACKNTNRRYIGVELSPKWHKVAVDRLNNVQANGQQTLFTM